MKPLLIGLSLLLAWIAGAANSVTLAWNSNSETNLAGYRLYYGTATRVYGTNVVTVLSPPRYDGTNWINGTNTQATVTNLPLGKTFFFAVTAYTVDGLESDYSEEVTFGFRPGRPQNLRLTGTTNGLAALWIDNPGTNAVVQWSPDLTNWNHYASLQAMDPSLPLYQAVYLAGLVPSDARYWRSMSPLQPLLPPGPLPETRTRVLGARPVEAPPLPLP